MPKRAPYKTKQITELLAFLKSVQGRHVTVNEICEHFKQEGITVGTTTVYRNLDRMVEQGLVAKYVIEGADSACYEYIGEPEDQGQMACYHCKCKKCGKLIHLQCTEVAQLSEHMLEHHDFELDAKRTVFYGLCGECRADS